MESVAELEKNMESLPQSQQMDNPVNESVGMQMAQKLNESFDGSPSEKKARFNENAQNGGVSGGGNIGSGGDDGAPNFANNNGGFGGMNRNRNRRAIKNRPYFQGQNKAANQEPVTDLTNSDAENSPANQNQNGNQGPDQGGRDNQVEQQQGEGQGGGQGFRGRRGGGGPGGHRGGQRSGGPFGAAMGGGPAGGRGFEDFLIAQKLRSIGETTLELPTIEMPAETKFSGRNRLYVGNLPSDVTNDELREMFKPYGEIDEISNLDRNYAFLKVDYHANAEKAMRALDGSLRKGRQLRVRFAPNATILRVSNLTQYVTNELLYKSFEVFGSIERAIIILDDRGRHTGEGIVEFTKKSSAFACLRVCHEKCFFLTASLRPCLVEPMEVNDDNVGLPEKTMNTKMPEFLQERSVAPRFADRKSFEHEYGSQWKQLHAMFKIKQEALKKEFQLEEEKLEAQMEYARYEHETELLRQVLRDREIHNERNKLLWEMRQKQVEDMRMRTEDNIRRHQGEMENQMVRHGQEKDMRLRQQVFGGVGNNSSFDNFAGVFNSPFDVFGGNTNNNSTIVENSALGGGPNPLNSFVSEFGVNNMNQGGNQRGNNVGEPHALWGRRDVDFIHTLETINVQNI
ncbi:protein no-on-transient A-like [Drosophila serrata]|uniref:protein no-on-transient A-like n=1 Tax=Drosophila serrata TaxID=7274 RepID=UPI000A1D0B7B|nr:protein no-on-transient A-like [Drosophila serrata]